MTIYNRPITQEDMDIIGTYMDDDIREELHSKLAPCEPDEFIREYLAADPDFEDLLRNEFYFDADAEFKVNTGTAISFEYDGIKFTISVVDNFCECYAEHQYQFGFELGQDGHIESNKELIDMLIANYDNGNIFIED